VLKMSRRGTVQDVQELSVQEDQALRRAFGRSAEPDARPAGAAVTRRHQRSDAGCWILCDCLGTDDRPPTLVPVSEAHIRRHYEPSGRRTAWTVTSITMQSSNAPSRAAMFACRKAR